MASNLITYDVALNLLRANYAPLRRTQNLSLAEALRFALAENILADESNPRFDNSEVDGYAISRAEDAASESELIVSATVGAGELASLPISNGEAHRIFTGAPIPKGIYAVVMQEDVERNEDRITLKRSLEPGQHIRRKGTDFQEGDLLIASGTVVSPQVIAQLAFTGKQEPLIYAVPIVTIITTGDELVGVEEIPLGAAIRDVNGVMLECMVRDAVPNSPTVLRLKDDADLITTTLLEACRVSDVVIMSGGASVGDRDFAAKAVHAIGNIVFHGVALRPGKPVLFGKVQNCLVFGLPGNPASASVCFELFVKEALRALAGWSKPELNWMAVPSGFDHPCIGREDFVRVTIQEGRIYPVGHQGSFGLMSLGQSSGLARFPLGDDIRTGMLVSVHFW